MEIDLDKREEWEAHIHDGKGNMFAIWIGHISGSFYGNFSYRHDWKIYQKKRGFHLRREMFDFYLSLPLGWKKIIDSKVSFGENNADAGIDLETGEFVDEVLNVKDLSIKK